MDYKEKYLKYKTKYLDLKEKLGGFSQNIAAGRPAISPPTRRIFTDIGIYPTQLSGYTNPLLASGNDYIDLIHLLYTYTMYEIEAPGEQKIVRILSGIHKVYIFDVLNVAGGVDENVITRLFTNIIDHNNAAIRGSPLQPSQTNLYILCDRYTDADNRTQRILNYCLRGRPQPNNIISITGKDTKFPNSDAGALDDFIYWVTAIAFSNWLSRDIEGMKFRAPSKHTDPIIAKGNPANRNVDPRSDKTSLILVSNDMQKLYDNTGRLKNLCSELDGGNIRIRINGIVQNECSDFFEYIKTKLREHTPGSGVMPRCAPITLKELLDTHHDPKNFELLKHNCVGSLGSGLPYEFAYFNTLSDLVEQIRIGANDDCSTYLKFMTLINWLQWMYFKNDKSLSKFEIKEFFEPNFNGL